jgi:hypothetical protein
MIQNIHERFRLARFIWADKIALFVGFLFSSLLLYVWSLAFLVVGNLGAKHLWENFGILGVELEILTVGSAWFVMRVTDFLAGGPTYRLFNDKSAQKGADLCMPTSHEHHHGAAPVRMRIFSGDPQNQHHRQAAPAAIAAAHVLV